LNPWRFEGAVSRDCSRRELPGDPKAPVKDGTTINIASHYSGPNALKDEWYPTLTGSFPDGIQTGNGSGGARNACTTTGPSAPEFWEE